MAQRFEISSATPTYSGRLGGGRRIVCVHKKAFFIPCTNIISSRNTKPSFSQSSHVILVRKRKNLNDICTALLTPEKKVLSSPVTTDLRDTLKEKEVNRHAAFSEPEEPSNSDSSELSTSDNHDGPRNDSFFSSLVSKISPRVQGLLLLNLLTLLYGQSSLFSPYEGKRSNSH